MLLALPLGELSPQVTERAHTVSTISSLLPLPQQKPCVSAAGALLYIIYIIKRRERSPDP